jgi:restriction endonuclease S subunit
MAILGKLKTYAEIFSGFTFRTLPANDPDGIVTIIQPKDIDQATGMVMYQTALKTNEFSGDSKHYLRCGDILISAKGKSTPIILYDGDEKKAIGSASLTIIRPKEKILSSNYISWYLQLPTTQQYLQASKTGTTVLNLSVKAVEEIDCWLPDLKEQQAIGKLHVALVEKKAKQLELLEVERQFINYQLFKQFIPNTPNKENS